MLETALLDKEQIVSHRQSTTFSNVAKTSLRNLRFRISFHICSMGFISGVYGGMWKKNIFSDNSNPVPEFVPEFRGTGRSALPARAFSAPREPACYRFAAQVRSVWPGGLPATFPVSEAASGSRCLYCYFPQESPLSPSVYLFRNRIASNILLRYIVNFPLSSDDRGI